MKLAYEVISSEYSVIFKPISSGENLEKSVGQNSEIPTVEKPDKTS